MFLHSFQDIYNIIGMKLRCLIVEFMIIFHFQLLIEQN